MFAGIDVDHAGCGVAGLAHDRVRVSAAAEGLGDEPCLKYPRFCSYAVTRAGVADSLGCEMSIRVVSYSAGGM